MALQININPNLWKRDLMQGLKGAFSSRKRGLNTSVIGLSAFFLTIFSANPGYSIQMISSGLQYWELAFITRLTGLLANTGYAGLVLTIMFSGLVGVTMTNTFVQLKANKVSMDALGALPGFLAGGCASCGVGVLTLLGLGGVLASMPFGGNLLRLGGVLLLTGLVINTGNPDTCKI